MATRKIFTDHEYQPSAFLVNPKVHSITDLSQHTGSEGQLVTNNANLYFHDGTNWFALIESNYSGLLTGAPEFDPSSGNVPFTVGAGHTGKVENLNADLLDGADTSTTAQDGAIPIYGSSGALKVGTPAVDGDAATKLYVDNAIQGLDIKASVAAATTGNITLSGNQTIDGISITAGMRVLVKNQSTASENGIYVSSASSWALAEDSDSESLSDGAYVFVEGGTVGNNTGWTYVNDGAYTWVQFSGAGQITAGDGLTKTGDTLDVSVASPLSISNDQITIADGAISGVKLDSGIAGDGLAFATGVLSVNVSGPLSISADTLTIADGAIGGAKLNTAIAGDGLGISAGVLGVNVSGPISISGDSLTIADGALTGIKLANDTVTSTQLANSITVTDLLVQDVSLATLIVGSTGGAGAELILDGAANGDGSGSDFAYIKMTSGDDLHIVNQQTAGTMLFATGSVARATIAADGKVKLHQNTGIGVDPSSTYKLLVSDDSKIDGTLEVSTPTANAHATTKLYVDDAVSAASVANIVAGDGLAKSGNTLSVNTTGPISISSDSVTIADQAITGAKLANNTVTSTQLADTIQVSSLGVGVSPSLPLDVYSSSGGCVVQFSANLSNAYEGSILKLKGGNLATNKIMLGDVSDEDIGAINYANNGNTMTFDVNASTRLTIESDGDVKVHERLGVGGTPVSVLSLVNGSRTLDFELKDTPASGDQGIQLIGGSGDSIGISAGGTGPGLVLDTINRLGIRTDSMSSQDSTADDLVVGDGLGHYGITLYSAATYKGTIAFGDPNSNYQGAIVYDHNNDSLALYTGGTSRLSIDSSGNGSITGTFGVATPTAGGHATTKTYVDNAVSVADVSNLVAGDGLAKSGNTVSVNTTSPISISSDSLTIADGALTGAKLANNTVTSTQLADTIQVSSLGVGVDPANYSSAANKLALGGTSGNQGLTIVSGSDSEGAIYWADGTSGNQQYRGYAVYQHASDQLVFGSAGANRLTIESDGDVKVHNNLGIGVSPTQKLHIADGGILLTDENAGQCMFQARNHTTVYTGSFDNTYGFEYRHASSGTQVHAALIHCAENNSARKILTLSSSVGTVAEVTSAGQFQVVSGALSAPSFSFVEDTNTGVSRPTTDAVNIVTGGSEAARFTTTGLGVGVSPTELLTLKGQGHSVPTFTIQRTNSTTTQFRITNAENSAATTSRGTSTGQWANVIDSNNSNLFLTSRNAGGTGGSIVLDADKVGIGVTPSETLDVNGVSRFRGEVQIHNDTTDIGAIGNYNGALNIQGTSTRDVSLGSDSYPQSIFIEGTNGDVKITNRLGIGVSPNAALTVRHNTVPQMVLGYASGTNEHRIYWDSSKLFLSADHNSAVANSGIFMMVNGSTVLGAEDDGDIRIYNKLGVGGTPTYEIDCIAGNARIAATSSSSSGVVNHLQADGTGAWVGPLSNHDLYFKTNNTARMKLESGGDLHVYNKLGVGVSPSSHLHISASTGGVNTQILSRTFLGSQHANHSTVLGYSVKADTGNTAQMVVTETSGSGATGNPAAIRMSTGAIEFHAASSGTANAAFDSLQMKLTTTGLGVGTASPNTKLHAYSSTAASNERTTPIDVLTLETENTDHQEYNGFGQGLVFRGSTYNNDTQRTIGRILHQINDDSINTTRGTSMSFQTLDNATATSPTTKLHINYDGSVGIGTTSPSTKLHVLHSSSTAGIFESSTTNTFIGLKESGGTLSYIGNKGGFFTIQTPGSSYSDKLVVLSGGNVGINTTSPTHRLTLGDISSAPTTGRELVFYRQSNDISTGYDSTLAIYCKLNSFGTYEGAHFRARGFKFQRHDGSQEYLSINNDGDVGIGTTGPGGKLEVQGSTNSSLILTRTSSGIVSNIEDDSGYGALALYQAGGGVKAYIAANADSYLLGGGLAIGTTSTTFQLEIQDDSNPTIRIQDNTNNSRLDLRAEDSSVLIRSTSNYPMRFDVNQTERMRIDTSGKVGIGTTDPSSISQSPKLAVVHSGAGIATFDTTDTNGGYITIADSNTPLVYLGSSAQLISSGGTTTDAALRSQGELILAAGGNNERMRIDANGNVGIGTASPYSTNSTKLDVRGSINFDGNALIAYGANTTTNIDHIWHNDGSAGGAGGTWNFCSDTTYKNNGNSRVRAGHFYASEATQDSYFGGTLSIGGSHQRPLTVYSGSDEEQIMCKTFVSSARAQIRYTNLYGDFGAGILSGTTGDFGIESYTNGKSIKFNVRNNDSTLSVMSLSAAGGVYIGTQYGLNGNLNLVTASPGASATISFRNYSSNASIGEIKAYQSSDASNGFAFGHSGSEYLKIESDGGVTAANGSGGALKQVARIHSADFTGDGSTTSFAITHNLQNGDAMVSVKDKSTLHVVNTQVVITNNNTVTITFNTAPANGAEYSVTVVG